MFCDEGREAKARETDQNRRERLSLPQDPDDTVPVSRKVCPDLPTDTSAWTFWYHLILLLCRLHLLVRPAKNPYLRNQKGTAIR